MNYWWPGLFVLLAVVLLIWLIKRNLKDKKDFEDEVINSEIKPEDTDPDKDKL